jgi:hypothetical protein
MELPVITAITVDGATCRYSISRLHSAYTIHCTNWLYGATCSTGFKSSDTQLYMADNPPSIAGAVLTIHCTVLYMADNPPSIADPLCSTYYSRLLSVVAEYPVDIDRY